jgi:enoyl-CoA hydratase
MGLVRVQRLRDTAVVTFARPLVNAFNLALMDELQERLKALAGDVPVGGLVLSGDGDAFSAGVDFKEVPRYGEQDRARMIAAINASVTLLYSLPTATVAAVNGHAIGGGLVMALACDARVAAEGAYKLGLTEVTAGLPYPACPMEVVRAEVEPAYRRHLVLSGELIEPGEACARGLIDELVAPQQLLDRAVELAAARAAATSYAVVKRQLKGRVSARMREVVASGRDPLLEPDRPG